MKDRLLLHICCAPCGVGLLGELAERYELVLFFDNPNIHPQDEHERRRQEVLRIAELCSIALIEQAYDPENWFSWAEELSSESEGGRRCEQCFALRLRRTAFYAKEHGFSHFATTLTSGRNKPASVINTIGRALAAEFEISFVAEDWKKGGRQERSLQASKEHSLYRQHYCGCLYSRR